MSYQVVTLPQAEKDIRDAVRWIARHSPKKSIEWGFDVVSVVLALPRFAFLKRWALNSTQ